MGTNIARIQSDYYTY